MKEIWQPIKNYEGLYEVSNLGQIRSVDRMVASHKGKTPYTQFRKGRIIRQADNGRGYKFIYLSSTFGKSRVYIHRAVANAFLPLVEGKDFINHKDGNKANNVVTNLEWCTCAENNEHKVRVLKHTGDRKGKPILKNRKKIGLFKNGLMVASFGSLREASISLGWNYNNLSSICSGKRKANIDVRRI